MEDNKNLAPSEVETQNTNEEYSLSDDRRVKVLSPGALVAKRFFRNRLAVTGLIILLAMFIFSFVGGLVSPYSQDQKFHRIDILEKDFAAAKQNDEFLSTIGNADLFSKYNQPDAILAINSGKTDFTAGGNKYKLNKINDDLYTINVKDEIVAIESKNIVSSSNGNDTFDFDFTSNALLLAANGGGQFVYNGKQYKVEDSGLIFDSEGKETAYVSNFIVKPISNDVFLTADFKAQLLTALQSNSGSFKFVDEDGEEYNYVLKYDAQHNNWNIKKDKETQVYDRYSPPSKEHWLGTDSNGMDMLTRLMYGGRISLIIGFIVVFIESIIGVILGGISGYFGGWIDNLIMRIVDIFYCIPSMPILIIIGAAMDAANLPSLTRMMYLMLILGFIGWPGIARMVRGQILSLREQEFMTATEATGIRVSRRIFKHLIPNVIPQLIVIMTMGLGDTIITEATLSFLGLGVRYPFASWGNIISDVKDIHVLTTYLFIWIPAGVLLLLTVLAFNIVGDGLRDAFDPKMKR